MPVGLGAHTWWEDVRWAHRTPSLSSPTKAVEIGTAVANAAKPGSQVHDEIYFETGDGRQETGETGSGFVRKTNRAGGLEGGITNGEELRVRGYMKPLSTLRTPLQSVDIDTGTPRPHSNAQT